MSHARKDEVEKRRRMMMMMCVTVCGYIKRI